MSTDPDDIIRRLRAFAGTAHDTTRSTGWALGDDAIALIARLTAEVAALRELVEATKAVGDVVSEALGDILGSVDARVEKSHERDGSAAIDAWNDLTERGPAAVKGATTDGES